MAQYEKEQKEKYDVDVAQTAINIVDDERKRWQDSVSFVTDRVAFHMRNLLRILRKNYWGVFDEPQDTITRRDKVWIPLTRTMVEGSVKNIDLDTKDINFRAKNNKGYAITKLIRALTRRWLDKNYFGEALDEAERALAIDGTVVWKFIESNGEVIRKNVDILNVYIDPTEDNIQSAFRFTERALMLPSEIARMSGWSNTEDLVGSKIISRIDGQYQSITTGSTAAYRDVWEMWGKIPKSLLYGKKKGDNGEDLQKDLIDGHIVVSGLEARDPKCHLIEENTKKDADGNALKPYEECRYVKVNNRWYGLGVAERALMLQIWINTIVNIRINRAYVSQLGLFKIRKGSGITPQMLSRLGSNGAIVVNNIDDIEQFVMQEASVASYKDEENIINWAQRDGNTYDVSVGEDTPASKPATTSVIESNSSKSGFKLVKDNIGSWLERCVDRHILPIIAKKVKIGDLIEVSDSDDLAPLVDTIVAEEAMDKLEEMKDGGVIPSADKLKEAMELAKEQIMKRDNVFIKTIQDLIASHVYTKVFITNEDMDPAVTVQNILASLRFVPQEAQLPLIKEAMDLMGLNVNLPRPQPQQPQQKISQSINFKDLPPDGQKQMAAEAGIELNGGSASPMAGPTGSVTPQGQGLLQALQGNNPQPMVSGANTLKNAVRV